MECKIDRNKATCACTAGCSKSGTCCDCVRYHRDRGEFPACFFSEAAEKTYDRSFGALLKDRQAQ